MNQNPNSQSHQKLKTIINLFRNQEIRSIWDAEINDYHFSVVDVVAVLTESEEPRKYWSVLKNRLKREGSQLTTKCSQLKMLSSDGKMYKQDTLTSAGIFRLIESIPSKNAEPFKLWLADLGKERIDEVFDPEQAITRAVGYYRARGYSEAWIKQRLLGILSRKALTDVWKEGGITKDIEYAILTNEIYKEWSGMKASEYKTFKGLRKESLRDNMTNLEVALTNLGEAATQEIADSIKPKGLKANKKVAKSGGHVAKIAKEQIEQKSQRPAITPSNNLLQR